MLTVFPTVVKVTVFLQNADVFALTLFNLLGFQCLDFLTLGG